MILIMAHGTSSSAYYADSGTGNITIATTVLVMILFWIVQLLLKRTELAITPASSQPQQSH